MLRPIFAAAFAVWSGPVFAENVVLPKIGDKDLDQRISEIIAGLNNTDVNAAFASVPKVEQGFRTDGNNPLGQYFPVAGTAKVSFTECFSDESVLIDSALVLPTTESCSSLPGIGTPSIPNSASVRWTYDAEKNGFFITPGTNTDSTVSSGAQFIECSSVPSSLLIAAQKASEGLEGVVGPSDTLAALNVESDKQTEASPADRATTQQCKTTDEFWTLQSAQNFERAENRLIGVTREAPRAM